jgi:hypothetical protein
LTVEGSQWDAIGHGHPVYRSLSWIVDGWVVLASWSSTPSRSPSTAAATGLRHGRRNDGATGSRDRCRERAAALDQAAGLDPLRQALERARHGLSPPRGARAGGRLVVGYGAPGRAITFLNAVGVGRMLSYVVVLSRKQGR